jgi:hypothetical protein
LVSQVELPDLAPIRKNSPGVDRGQEMGTKFLESLSKFGAVGVLMHKTLQPLLDMVAVWILFF